MGRKIILITIICLCLAQVGIAQQCTALGQNPETAFPVCGTEIFNQTTVPLCGNTPLVVPGCDNTTPYADKNPFWYKFTCFQAGTLSFVITPMAGNEDYDWQLYDITGLPPNAVYTTPSTIVTGNWSGSSGPTGASSSGVTFIQCSSIPADNKPRFARSPNLIAGHNYILLVSHYTDTQSGYSLSFGGGTAVITDDTEPHFTNARAICDGTIMHVKLNKQIKCNSIAANGSDFAINTALTNIVSATGITCSNSFDTDSIMLTLSNPLPAGNYIISLKNGSDSNTLKDNCDRTIPVGENKEVTIFSLTPTPLDSVATPGCAPTTLELIFKKPIKCSSIAADGSNFSISGSYPVNVIGAGSNCSTSGVSDRILVQLSAPLLSNGNFQITLTSSIVDECGLTSPVGSFANFSVKDTVNATFSYNIFPGCVVDTVRYAHNGLHGVNSWLWSFDNLAFSSDQNAVQLYSTFGEKRTQLIVTNGTCRDTAQATLYLNNFMNASFESSPFVCPGEKGIFKDKSEGFITSWNWDFGNGHTSTQQNPPPQTFIPNRDNYTETVTLIISNDIGCKDTISHDILVIDNCYIAVPSAFTPNGDGLNDYLFPYNAYKTKDLTFSVYNRFGQRIFFTNNWTVKWDGNFKGRTADPGTYVWLLTYTNTDTQLKVEQKGTSILIR